MHGTPTAVKDAPAERLAVLRNKSAVMGRFISHIAPILVDVYATSVTTTIHKKTLMGSLKAVSFLEPEGVKEVLVVSLLLRSAELWLKKRYCLERACRRLCLVYPVLEASKDHPSS